MTKPKTFLTMLFSLLLAARVLALDIYVATNGTGSGTSWEDATNSLAGAIDYIENLEIPEQGTIHLSNGVYEGVSECYLEYTVAIIGKTGNPADVILVGDGEKYMFDQDTSGKILSGVTITNGGGATAPIVAFAISDCIIVGNTGGNAGGLYAGSATRCVFRNNVGNLAGAVNGAAQLYSCLLVDNTGGIGGAADAMLYNCTVAQNVGTNGAGGIGGEAYYAGIYNTISWGNIGGADTNISQAYYSCGSGTEYQVETCITNDPLFIGSGNYRLQAGSPCINAGTNSTWTTLTDTDLDGNKRRWPANGRPDMGAYEFGSGTVYRKKVMFMKTE